MGSFVQDSLSLESVGFGAYLIWTVKFECNIKALAQNQPKCVKIKSFKAFDFKFESINIVLFLLAKNFFTARNQIGSVNKYLPIPIVDGDWKLRLCSKKF